MLKKLLKTVLSVLLVVSVISFGSPVTVMAEEKEKNIRSNTTYFVTMNFNRQNYAHSVHGTDAEKTNVKNALQNPDFRRALLTGLKKQSYTAVERVRNGLNNPLVVYTTDGRSYGSLVTDYLKELSSDWNNIDLSDGQEAFYNKTNCLKYIEQAKKDGIQFPVTLDVPVTNAQVDAANALKEAMLEASDGQIILAVAGYDSSTLYDMGYFCENPEEMDYDLYLLVGWGLDRAKPETMFEVLDYSSVYMGLQPEYENDKELYDKLGITDIMKYVHEAEEETDHDKEYQLSAKAEAILLNNAVIIPYSTTLKNSGYEPSIVFNVMGEGDIRKLDVIEISTGKTVNHEGWSLIRANDSRDDLEGITCNPDGTIIADKTGYYRITTYTDVGIAVVAYIVVVPAGSVYSENDYSAIYDAGEFLTDDETYEKLLNAEISNTEEGLFHYFVTEAMSKAIPGNFAFDPVAYRNENPALAEEYGDNWVSYYVSFLDKDNIPAERIYGENRYETSLEAAEELRSIIGADKYNAVVVTTGAEFADALSGSYLANINSAPLLLIRKDANKIKYAENVRNYITDNVTSGGTVYILGGEAAVPGEWLEGLSGYEIIRLEGSNRYNTNLEVLNKAGYKGGDILVCTGEAFPDSLSASAVDLPILLVKKTLSKKQKEFLGNCVDVRFHIIGGTGAVNEDIESELGSYGTVVERISGANRYETSVKIAETFFDSPELIVMAYGETFPDGLSAGALAYNLDAPLILVNPAKKSGKRYAEEYAVGLDITDGYVLGGSGLIDDATVKEILQGKEEEPSEPDKVNIKVWVSDYQKDLMEKQINDFVVANQDISLTVSFETAPTINSEVIADKDNFADLFMFDQVQTQLLVKNDILMPLGSDYSDRVIADNRANTVKGASWDGKIYGFPVSENNGYFMYYDKSIIAPEHLNSLEEILSDCENAGKTFNMDLTSSWYSAAFFFATGCVSEWEVDSNGDFISVNDTFSSPEGLIAVKGIKKLMDSSAFATNGDCSQFESNAAIVISGTWGNSSAESILGDNYGVKDLPSFTVEGNSYHLGSYSGGQSVGIKKQDDSTKTEVLMRLADYLSSKNCQKERWEQFSIVPSNKELTENNEIELDAAILALLKQNEFATPQGPIHDLWWSNLSSVVMGIIESTDDSDYQKLLESYDKTIQDVFIHDGDLVFAGSWNNWNNKDEDCIMNQNGNIYSITLTINDYDYIGGRIISYGDWDCVAGYDQVVIGLEYLSGTDGDNNLIFKEGGIYTITYDKLNNEISIYRE